MSSHRVCTGMMTCDWGFVTCKSSGDLLCEEGGGGGGGRAGVLVTGTVVGHGALTGH